MKVITVAAGAGSRLLEDFTLLAKFKGEPPPKVIFPIHNKEMFRWSMESFHHWITSGLISHGDLCFVLQTKHETQFGVSKKIRQHVGSEVQFCFVDDLTKGPAETALKAMELVEDDEELLINDCDHFFSGDSLANLIRFFRKSKQNSDYLLLSSVETNSDIPSWSYIDTLIETSARFPRVIGIREKDPELAKKKAPGVIGCYYFSSKKLFQELYEKTFREKTGEYFMSNMFACAIEEGVPIFSTKARFGYPLGTSVDIENFESKFKNRMLEHLGKTIFCDIDGVLINHDAGYHAKNRQYDYTSRIIDSNVAKLQDNYFQGDVIVLTTTRPEKERAKLELFLTEHNIYFHQLIMGLNPGTRILINDRKPSDYLADTAVAKNILRNSDFGDLSKITNFADPVLETLTAGSGVETIRVRNTENISVIRKLVPDENRYTKEIEILKLQSLWYDEVQLIEPGYSPRVIFCGSRDSLFTLELEDLGDLPKLSNLIKRSQTNQNELNQTLSSLFNILNVIYEKTASTLFFNAVQQKELLLKIILKKAIPAIENLFGGYYSIPSISSSTKKLLINSDLVTNPLLRLKDLAENPELLQHHGFSLYADFNSMIHGDLSMENILVSKKSGVKLIDPLGAFMDPTKNRSTQVATQKTTPCFDMIKILQSMVAGYELWSEAKLVTYLDDKEGLVWRDDLLPKDPLATGHITNFFGSLGVKTDEKNIDFLLAMQLFRIIPYKLSIRPDVAWYCLAAGTKFLERSLK